MLRKDVNVTPYLHGEEMKERFETLWLFKED
jgi:hypothetical protein